MFEQLKSRFVQYRLYRHTVHELARLDRHTLRDIGFERMSMRELKARARHDVAEEFCG